MKITEINFTAERIQRAINHAQKRRSGFEDPLFGDLVASDSFDFVCRQLDHLLREAADPFPHGVQRLDQILHDDRILPAHYPVLIRKFKAACSGEQLVAVRRLVIDVLNVNQRLAETNQETAELSSVPMISGRSGQPVGYWLELWRQIFEVPLGANRFMAA